MWDNKFRMLRATIAFGVIWKLSTAEILTNFFETNKTLCDKDAKVEHYDFLLKKNIIWKFVTIARFSRSAKFDLSEQGRQQRAQVWGESFHYS